LYSDGHFEIRKEGGGDDSSDILILNSGSIVVLSKDSRWKYEHRVVP